MSKEKQIEEMACKNCIHYEVCMYVNAQAVEYARAENCKLFKNNAGYRKQSEGVWTLALGTYGKCMCSNCKSEAPIKRADDRSLEYIKTKFCPNCGAKMKGGAE